MLKRKIVALSFLGLGIFILIVVASALGGKNQSTANPGEDSSCGDCHICSEPTKEKPCLRECPRLSKTVVLHSPQEGPSVVILDQLSELYVPVIFPHKLHAQMTTMGKGCSSCHHHSPAGHFPPCRECHGGPSNPENLSQPGLKGAYHRQCMSCHREWSHDTECSVCHAKKTTKVTTTQAIDTTDIMGLLHPNIQEPEKKVYQTSWNKGTMVTFHHREHVELFNLKCVDCHQEENCNRCHDIEKKTKKVKSIEEHHKPCSSCHQMASCVNCHVKSEAPGFSHAKTGWPLKGYHQNLSCRACHPSGQKFAKLNRECTACHSSWNNDSFKHTVTGLTLDEIHSELECNSCHLENKFEGKPSCANCHDDNRTYPESSPGTFTGKKI